MRRARRGDAESLAYVVERLTPLLLVQARLRLGPRLAREVEAEDVVQDVWAIGLQGLEGLRMETDRETPVLLRFLSTTLLYRVNDLLRRHLRRSGPGDGDPPRPSVGALPAETLGVVTRAVRDEASAEVRAAIEGLGEPERELLVLRGIEQRTNAEVAERLGLTPNAASLRYGRALRKLRERLPGTVLEELERE